MKMPDVYLTGELRMRDYEIYRIMHSKDDELNYVLGFLLIEDCNRKTELKDFPFLQSVYPDPSEFEGGDNVIKIKAILTESLDGNSLSVIEHIGISLVETKENVDCLFSVEIKSDLENWIDLLSENPFSVYSELLKYTEKKPNVDNLSKDSLKRLFQDV